MGEISKNINEVNEKISLAKNRAGRENEPVELVAVSKFVETDRMLEALECGVCSFGENRAQELMQKYDIIIEKFSNILWNFIGQLQKNKVKCLIDRVDLIQSLDNKALATEIQRLYEANGKVANVLIQVNIGKEGSKGGVDPDSVYEFIRWLQDLSNVHVKGLMCIPPALGGENVRPYFRDMKSIFDSIARKNMPNAEMEFLSMGMSGDYETAIEEGSNMVRIGSAIFGKRSR